MYFTEYYIRNQVSTRPEELEKAIIELWLRQTDAERVEYETRNLNYRGFNKRDARLFSGYAEQITAGTSLDREQWDIARKRIQKYVGQIQRMRNGEGGLGGRAPRS